MKLLINVKVARNTTVVVTKYKAKIISCPRLLKTGCNNVAGEILLSLNQPTMKN